MYLEHGCDCFPAQSEKHSTVESEFKEWECQIFNALFAVSIPSILELVIGSIRVAS